MGEGITHERALAQKKKGTDQTCRNTQDGRRKNDDAGIVVFEGKNFPKVGEVHEKINEERGVLSRIRDDGYRELVGG